MKTGSDDRVWGVLVVEVPGHLEDELVACLADDSLGARVGSAGAGRTRVEVFLETPVAAESAAGRASALLRGWKLDPVRCGLHVESVADERWVERFQAGLRPFPFAAGFTVFPDGRPEPFPGRIPIVLVPGRAFGTGEHPTTRLCARELERRVSSDGRWVDLGCGSAILAIVARHCGAGRVLAVDSCGEAVDVAGEVLDANRLAGKIELRQGSVESIDTGIWDGVVANISASFLRSTTRALASLLRPGGLLLASGFLADDLPGLRPAFEGAGFEEIANERSDVWGLLVLRTAGGRWS